MMEILPEDKRKIDHWVAKFPTPKGAVLMALRIMQDRHNWLPREAIDAVSDYLKISKTEVYEVVSFYSMYRLKPGGRNYLKVCTSLSCCLMGADEVIQHVENSLSIKKGETTDDQMITLMETECLGACQMAPVALVNDTEYIGSLTRESLDQLLDQLKEKSSE